MHLISYASQPMAVEMNIDVLVNPEINKLHARIAELEAELSVHKSAAEKGSKLLQLMWGYSFSRESLH